MAATPISNSTSFRLGDWQVEPKLNLLRKGDQQVTVENKTMDVLVLLASRANDVVSSDELIDDVWGGRPMGENPVYKAITNLRKALGDDPKKPEYIETIARKGYRLVAPVSIPESKPAERPRTAAWPIAAGVFLLLALAFWNQTSRDDAAGVVTVDDRSIAVLPFENLSGDPDNDFFCRGIAETLLNRLAGVPDLRVVARRSSFSIADTEITEIIERLSVGYVLAGSVQQHEQTLRISARLLDTSGNVVWAQTFDRDNDNVFSIQSEIAQSVVQGISSRSQQPASVQGPQTDNFDAYRAYLLGNEYLRRRSEHWASMALDAFNESLALDPDFAAAHAGAAIVLAIRGGHDTENLSAAQYHAGEALRLDPNLAEAHAVAGLLLTQADDEAGYTASIEPLRRAIELNPSLIEAYNWLQISLMVLGRDDESIETLRQALTIDPLNHTLNMNYAVKLHADGQLDAAREYYIKVLDFPDVPGYSYDWLSNVELSAGNYEQALNWVKLGGENGGLQPDMLIWYAATVAGGYARLGMFDEANRWLPLAAVNYDSHWWLGGQLHVYLRQQDYDILAESAARHVEAHLEDEELTPWSRQMIGHIAFENGDMEAAIQYLEPLYEPGWILYNGPGGLSNQFPEAQQLVLALRSVGRDEQAERILSDLWQHQMEFRAGRTAVLSDLLIAEAVTYALMGNEETAVERLQEAVDAGWRDYYMYLGSSQYRVLDELPGTVEIIESVRLDLTLQRERVVASEQTQPFEIPAVAEAVR
ncbi:MAG: winged helix-turn-helix domain-containing protein [Woeseiaceae bacterium]|nr:winged helix-turn-helix domain-containing protein [Woeseiaceae bacterium]